MLKIQILQRVQIHLRWILTNLDGRKTNLNWKMHQVLHSSLLRRHLWTNNWHITSLVKFKFVAMPFSANINKKDTQIIFIAKFPAFQTFNVRLAKISFWMVFFIFFVERLEWWWQWNDDDDYGDYDDYDYDDDDDDQGVVGLMDWSLWEMIVRQQLRSLCGRQEYTATWCLH